MLDLKTVFILWIAQATTAGVMFFIAWWHKPNHRFYLLWSLGFLVHATGVVLLLGRGHLPDFASIELANGVALCAFFFWVNGLRKCDLKPIAPLAFAPALIWTIAMLLPPIRGELAYRLGAYALSGASGYVLLAWTALDGRFGSRRLRRALAGIWLLLACNSGSFGLLSLIDMPHDFMTLAITPAYGIIAMTGFLATMLIGAKIVMNHSEYRLRELIGRDPLTGALNRRGMADAISDLKTPSADDRELALLLFDIDHFKKINDTYGHQAGDAALVAFARICTTMMKPRAVFGRSGGEEFSAVVPVIDRDEALALGKEIIDRIATTPIATDRGLISITTSLGIAACRSSEFDFDRLMSRADKALYRAKAEGRNRAVDEDGRTAAGFERSPDSAADRQVGQLRQISAA